MLMAALRPLTVAQALLPLPRCSMIMRACARGVAASICWLTYS